MTQSPDTHSFSMLRAQPGDPPQLRVLRIAVVGMGLVLVVGTALVISRIIYLATQPLPVASSSPGLALPVAMQPGPPALGLVAEARLALPAGAKVRTHAISGSLLSVHYEAPGGEGIAIVDLTTGRQVSLVRIEPAAR